jgi:U4/U6.U5 tri-snRNP-associated protein 1
MDEGEERILTLKDSRILEDEGELRLNSICRCSEQIWFVEDALENVEIAENERTKKNNELKIKRRDYTGYDDEEFTGGSEGMKRSLLSKYDDFLEGPKETVSGYR